MGDKKLELLLEGTSISKLLEHSQHKNLIVVETNHNLEKALLLLSKNKILSAPVFDVENNQFIGFVDMFDVLSLLLKNYTTEKEIQQAEGKVIKLRTWSSDFEELHKRSASVFNLKANQISNASGLNPFLFVSPEEKLPALLFIFQKGVHRVALTDDHGRVKNIITQSNVIQFLAKNSAELGSKGNRLLSELGFANKKIVTVLEDVSAVHAFHLMKENRVSAVGVVNHSGQLIANISISDLRGLTVDNFASLTLSVSEYLNQFKEKKPLAILKEDSTLQEAILKLSSLKVHRLWVLDDLGRPAGLVSLTDVIVLLDLFLYSHQSDSSGLLK
eukprot:TRINITY_DN1448_c0_g1_i1.p1 TRINITY_DN1448_c0_g1~~TRINITY_DN1448_c0_g1_i1.p1  ORF type:complete len:360 (+),score=102.24 TRINITY_DN1448_c0_g1_i1:89-1081(+)